MKADEALVRRLRSFPEREFDLLLRVSSNVQDAADEVGKHSVEVRRRFRLIRALAVRVSGQEALRLMKEPWVVGLEEDREVGAL